MSQIVLFDLPSKESRVCWSLNPWKTRLALNFKGLDYQTTWLEYPDVAPTLKPHVPPNPTGTAYTIPTVQLSDGSYVMESKKIAARLEKEHPTPSLHLDSPLLEEVERLSPKVLLPIRGMWMAAVYQNVLAEKSKKHFGRTREASLGKPILQYAKETGGEEAWMEVLPGIKELGELIKAKEGPFVMGNTPSYADFVIVGWLRFFRIADESIYQRFISIEPAYEKLYDAAKPWLERDDH